MIGEYTVQRKVADLPEGYEFQENRFIADKNDRGCHVQYRSQEGDIRYIMVGFKGEFASKKSWMDANGVIDCVVDFVPDSHRELWIQLQKLGKCFLEYYPEIDLWVVRFPENPTLHTLIERDGGIHAAEAIEIMSQEFVAIGVVYNGHRWFDCRDITDFKKISDDEAKKLMNENN